MCRRRQFVYFGNASAFCIFDLEMHRNLRVFGLEMYRKNGYFGLEMLISCLFCLDS